LLPIFKMRSDLQQEQAVEASIPTRSRGRWCGNNLRKGRVMGSQLSGACPQFAAIENRIRRFVMMPFEVEQTGLMHTKEDWRRMTHSG
jgi:hypothetical protein